MAESSFTYDLTAAQGQALKTALEENGFEFKPLAYGHFQAKRGKCNIAYYESGRMVVQGKDSKEVIEFILEPFVLGAALMGYEEVNDPLAFAVGLNRGFELFSLGIKRGLRRFSPQDRFDLAAFEFDADANRPGWHNVIDQPELALLACREVLSSLDVNGLLCDWVDEQAGVVGGLQRVALGVREDREDQEKEEG